MKKLIIALMMFLTVACTTTKYVQVPVETTKTEYVSQNKVDSTSVKDSVYLHDSIYVHQKGDTVFFTKYQTQYKYLDRIKYINRTDTLIQRDSIPVPYEVVKEVEIEKKLNWFQKALMYLGVALLLAVVGKVALMFIKK